MLLQFGMGENVGQKLICRTRSTNPKKIFAQNIGKVVRLTQNTDIAFLQQNISQLSNIITMSKQACETVQRSGTKIFASNSQDVGKFVPCAAPFLE